MQFWINHQLTRRFLSVDDDVLTLTLALKGYGNIFLFGLSIRTFGVIGISVVNFFEACSVSEILKDKRH